ncbi:hypothetical protein CO726_24800 [Bacillus fungorum]|uniref:Restriction endonuclease type II-like domain-containing protein n=1 Tax=Bacillus fungorum TaxID=2039284 RepID=A0A2G6Q7I6_9BACI|nr:DUF559 domain-containing protein [Bacillus fungorum]PIE92788.1 hypothetical protein CO726_24800 [Bacillus fungorum]
MLFIIFLISLFIYGLAFTIKNMQFEIKPKQRTDQRDIGIKHNREKCGNRFEREVFDYLVKLGYYPISQVKEGRYRLDFVLLENNKRIVIECDGDIFHNAQHDKKRDAYLKKVGYVSVLRIKYSQWKEDKHKCILRLESKLYELQHLPSTHPSFHLQFDIK